MSRLEQLSEMLKEDPDDSFLNYALALEYGKAGDLRKAIDTIETMLKVHSTYLGAYYQLGKYYEELKEDEKAASTYKKGIMLAQEQKNLKTLGELRTALDLLD